MGLFMRESALTTAQTTNVYPHCKGYNMRMVSVVNLFKFLGLSFLALLLLYFLFFFFFLIVV